MMRVPLKRPLALHFLSAEETEFIQVKWLHCGWLAEIERLDDMDVEGFANIWKMVFDVNVSTLFAICNMFFHIVLCFNALPRQRV
jgi:hypothetical protein